MDAMYTITVTLQFSAAHAIRLYDGSLEPLHGHNWHIEVSVAGSLDAIETVMDFHELQRIVQAIIGPAQNANLNDIAPFAGAAAGELAVNPTAERVAWWIGEATAKQLPTTVKLRSVRVEEAPGCFAMYQPR